MTRALVETGFGTIQYRDEGAGPVVLLLHANQQSSSIYRELMTALARSLRVIAIDLPSHGGSDHVDFQPTIADYAGCVIEVMDALGIDTFTPQGENTGAAIAVELAGSYPERVARAILVNCPFLIEPPEQVLAPFKSDFRPSDPTGFPALRTIDFILETDPKHSPMHPTQDWMDRMNLAQIEVGRDRWQMLTALAEYDLSAGLTRVSCPVLILTAQYFYQLERLPKIEAGLTDVTSAVVLGARVCMGWEFADQIAERTLEFAGV
jgi:pimeloyl-ACP methyl ester carboxylesterase